MPRSATTAWLSRIRQSPPPLGVKPPVRPVVLYCLHWEKRRFSHKSTCRKVCDGSS